MKKILLFIGLIIMINYSWCNEVNTNNPSQKIDSTYVKLNQRINKLEKEAEDYKIKEDYFSTILSDQSSRFNLITAAILALFGGLSFGIFKYEIYNIKQKYEKQLKKHEKKEAKYIIKISETIITNYKTTGNTYRLIADTFNLKKLYVNEFDYAISSATSHMKALDAYKTLEHNIEKEKLETYIRKSRKVVIKNIKQALDCFNTEIKNNSDFKEKFSQETIDRIYENNDILANTDEKEIQILAAKLRIEFHDFINN